MPPRAVHRLAIVPKSVWIVILLGIGAGPGCVPIVAPAPEQFTFAVDVPEVTPLSQTASTQRQGGVSITVASARFDTATHAECSYDFARGLAVFEAPPPGASLQTDQQFSETSRAIVGVNHPTLAFLVTIRNNMARVFRGAGALVEFKVDSHVEAVEKQNYTEFLNALLPPGSESQLTISGPPLTTLRDGTTVGVFLYDVVTAIDGAGNVTKRENFEWYFRVTRRHMTVSTTSATRNVWVPGPEVRRIALLLPNNTQRLLPNKDCMPGVIAARGAGPRADSVATAMTVVSSSAVPVTNAPIPQPNGSPNADDNVRLASAPLGGNAESIAVLDRQVRENPYRPDLMRSLIPLYLQDSAYERAIPLARKVIAAEPLNAEAYRSLANAFRAHGEAGAGAGSNTSLTARARSDSASKYDRLLGGLTGDAVVEGFMATGSSAECAVRITSRSSRLRSFQVILQYMDHRGSVVASDTVRAVDLAPGSMRMLRSSRRASGVVGYRYRAS
jgi:hypothetical protein